GWNDLEYWMRDWNNHSEAQRMAILRACGELARRLHSAHQMHGCFYPKHIFLRESADGFDAQLIDLEKTRRLVFGKRDRIKDLEPLLRRASSWS
ncbi:lipopolysaccharide kinase InaA family protein, partial [Pseudomonas viridiflava]|uniref:lipopolysaccharide kinase InaA family protein n=1 Tax=Pseudomonas viridiflava TaxID=33069 RepID=UPI001F15724A